MAYKNGGSDDHQDQDDQGKGNVVDLAAMRRAQATLKRKAAEAKAQKAQSAKFSQRYGRQPIRWYHYLQFIAFLGIVAYLSRMCAHA